VLLAEIRSVVYRRSLPLATGNLPVVLSELGPRAGVAGAALARLERRLRQPGAVMTAPFLKLTGGGQDVPRRHRARRRRPRRHRGRGALPARQNGAGKSTLIKVLAGVHRPDAGTIEIDGAEVSFAGPQAAIKAGIATIYQELDLVDDLSVAGTSSSARSRTPPASCAGGGCASRPRRSCTAWSHRHPAHRAVGKLSTAAKQVVSMARALSGEARLIIMDEPSAVLAHDEVANLFRLVAS